MFRLLFTYLQCLWHIIQSVFRAVLSSVTNEYRFYYPSSPDTKPSMKESLNVTEVEKSQPSFALIIGINKYKTVKRPFLNLKGAVLDADHHHVQSYLQKHLGARNSRIRTLRDSEATRATILHEINALITDDRIQHEDSIVIFYAGHGSTAPTPKRWESGGPTTQLFLPHDYLCENEKGQKKVHGIPDRALCVLLGRLASVGGDNISGIKEVDSKSHFLVRGIDTMEEFPADLDQDIIVSSHEIPAACGAAELEHAKGFDTTALPSALVAYGTDMVTYEDLLQLIQAFPGQNTQCEDTRILFDGKASRHDRVLYKTDPFTTTTDIVSDASHLPEEGHALKTRVGIEKRLRLHVNTNAAPSLIETLKKSASQDFLLVEKEEAELSFTLEQEGVAVNILDSFVTTLGLTRMPLYIEPNADGISNFIDAAAHFYFYLRRNDQMKSLHGKIDVIFTEVFQSKEEYDDNLQPLILPMGPNLNRGNIIDLEVQGDKMYGMEITNNSDMALYPSLFFFDNSDLSIMSYYQPPTSGAKIDPPLLPNSSVTIGYGAGSDVPYCYSLRDNQDIDIGHLKLFLSTEYVDLSHVAQHSPFESVRQPLPSANVDLSHVPQHSPFESVHQPLLSANVDLSHVPQQSPFESVRQPLPSANVPCLGAFANNTRQIWDTILIPVVQRRSTDIPSLF